MQAVYYCRACSTAQSSWWMPNIYTPSSTQIVKDQKHTQQRSLAGPVGIFRDPTSVESHLRATLALGITEVDSFGRTNALLVHSQWVGDTYSGGFYSEPDNVVRVALPTEPSCAHPIPYPPSSVASGIKCPGCGRPLP